jgi:hypothetical protein
VLFPLNKQPFFVWLSGYEVTIWHNPIRLFSVLISKFGFLFTETDGLQVFSVTTACGDV